MTLLACLLIMGACWTVAAMATDLWLATFVGALALVVMSR